MNFLTFLIPAGLKEWARILLIGFLVFSVTYPLARCEGVRTERAAGKARLDRANVLFLQQKAIADELASRQRITDLVAVQQNERNLRDAIALTPDTAPDAVRVQLGCARLRAAGRDTASLPTVCRTGGGTQAPTAR